MINIDDVTESKRMDTMNAECPHCGDRLIEKHEEVETERGKETKFIWCKQSSK